MLRTITGLILVIPPIRRGENSRHLAAGRALTPVTWQWLAQVTWPRPELGGMPAAEKDDEQIMRVLVVEDFDGTVITVFRDCRGITPAASLPAGSGTCVLPR